MIPLCSDQFLIFVPILTLENFTFYFFLVVLQDLLLINIVLEIKCEILYLSFQSALQPFLLRVEVFELERG